jgi:hypothetical protein
VTSLQGVPSPLRGRATAAHDQSEQYDPWTDERGKEPVDVDTLTRCVQRAIRLAPHQERERLWQCYRSELDKAQEITESRMPWEPASTVSRILGYDALRCLYRTFAIVSDSRTRHRLITAVADACDSAFGSPDNGKPRHLLRCADADCSELFTPVQVSQRYHSQACRQRTFKRKRRAEVTAPAPGA